MRASVLTVVVLGTVLAAAAPAGAQSPSYGGGQLPAASPPRGYTPTAGLVLQPRGGTMALRFDTSIFCGSKVYDTVGRATVPFDGRSFTAKAARQYAIGTRPGNRIVYRWRLRGEVDDTIAVVRLHITGFRQTRTGGTTRCRRKPDRTLVARAGGVRRPERDPGRRRPAGAADPQGHPQREEDRGAMDRFRRL